MRSLNFLFRFVLFLVGLLMFFSAEVGAQSDTPWSFAKNLSVQKWEQLPFLDVSQCLSEDKTELAHGLKNLPFSRNISLLLTPMNSGVWSESSQGRIWLLGIESRGALSLMAVLEDMHLRDGVRLYVYDEQKTRVLGPFKGDAPLGVLPLSPVAGERIIVELNVPQMTPSFGRIRLTQVGRVYRDIETMMLKASIDNASPCHIDVNCPAASAWQTDKRAVVRLMVNKITRNEYGTGVLINNTALNGTPYVLTASHLLSTQEDASRSIFFFDYESVACGGARGSKARTVSGSSLVSVARTLDFALVELSSAPPLIYEPYYAGWNVSGSTPVNAVDIQHPWADMKKISFADPLHAIVTASYASTDLTCEPNAHWKVSVWSQGTTEPGSSGSPLFDGSHRVVGTLSGGASTCESPINDFFAKLSFQYNFFSTYDTARLKPWLDPVHSNTLVLNGYDPVAAALSGCDTLTHVEISDTKTLYPVGSKGYASGHNSLRTNMFAERFRSSGTSILYGALYHLAKVSSNGSLSRVTVKVWSGTSQPEVELYSKTFVAELFFPKRNNLVVFDAPISVTGNYFVGYVISYAYSSDTFAVSQAVSHDPGISTCLVNSGSGWVEQSSIMQPAVYASLAIGVIGKNLSYLPSITTDVTDIAARDKSLVIYPNPVNDVVTACFPDGEVEEVFCYDMMGRVVPLTLESSRPDPSSVGRSCISIRVSGLAPGMYLLSVRTKTTVWRGRFVKSH